MVTLVLLYASMAEFRQHKAKMVGRLPEMAGSCFDKLRTNGKTSMISIQGLFVLRLSKGEKRVALG